MQRRTTAPQPDAPQERRDTAGVHRRPARGAHHSALPGTAGPANDIVKQVAQRLGNTSCVCRKFYPHPEVPNFCEAQSLDAGRAARSKLGMSPAECALLQLLDPWEPAKPKKPAARRSKTGPGTQ